MRLRRFLRWIPGLRRVLRTRSAEDDEALLTYSPSSRGRDVSTFTVSSRSSVAKSRDPGRR